MRRLNTAAFFMEFKQSELKNRHKEDSPQFENEGAAVYVCQSTIFIGKKRSNEGFPLKQRTTKQKTAFFSPRTDLHVLLALINERLWRHYDFWIL